MTIPRRPFAYLDLVGRFNLRPIRSDVKHERAREMVEFLCVRIGDADWVDDERDYADVLTGLIISYEDAGGPFPGASGADVLRELIVERGSPPAEVAAVAGISPSTLAAALSGKRPMSRRTIEALAAYFRINPVVFLTVPSRLEAVADARP